VINGKPIGGLSTLVRNYIPHRETNLTIPLQPKAVSISAHKTITICLIYLPPTSILNPKEINRLDDQLSSRYILVGDMNAHSIIWGCKDINDKGRKIEHFIAQYQLCLLTNGKTHIYSSCNW